jgi:PAS domain S-box-containing protein
VDSILLTSACAPALWWVIIGPLRRIAIQEHQRSQTIVANASEGIITFDRKQSIVSCNQAGSDLLVGSADGDPLLGQSIRRLIPDLPLVFDALPSEYRLVAVRPDGTRLPVQVSVSEYPSESGQILIAVVRDLTEAEQAEQEKITMARETEALRAQQMTTLAQLATGVAHEIRNPLTAIKMLIQVNRAKFADEGLPTDDLELVETEIRRMEKSVNSLLDYARPEKSEFIAFTVQTVVRRTIQLIDGRCVAQGIDVTTVSPDETLSVVGDPSQIQQLLLNLSLNAIDAMPDGGILEIAAARSDSEIVITVSDTGAGIGDDVLGQLFSPFVTSKPNGVGLGLGICRRIAEAHHGTLDGANRVSGGARFRLTLPVSQSCNIVEGDEASCRAY